MSLQKILAISGKPGLFELKLQYQNNGHLINKNFFIGDNKNLLDGFKTKGRACTGFSVCSFFK